MPTGREGVKGAIAAGHPLTAEAGCEVLRAGGNAYDAAIAAFFSACIAEPVLASLGGGGFLLSQTAGGEQRLFDCFVQTPIRKLPEQALDFTPIWADFGTTRQEFHIGHGAIATPGIVKGVFEVHRALGSLPMTELVQPAVERARSGIRLDALQAYILQIVTPILTATPALARTFSGDHPGQLAGEGDILRFPELADTLESLAREGDALFYQGDVARLIIEQCSSGGGHLQSEDLARYRVFCRRPLQLRYREHEIISNPPPSSGGILIAFALELWQRVLSEAITPGSWPHLALLASVMETTNQARIDAHIDAEQGHPDPALLLDEKWLARYSRQVRGRAKAYRGTTHISVIDRWCNVATLTLSNGEGCGSLVPGTGIMLNNMLGEEDLNPHGFQRWQPNQRMTSMMAPTIINQPDGAIVALGSGGSNRIRTALLQTIINRVDFNLALSEAVGRPRIHVENQFINLEEGLDEDVLQQLLQLYPQHKCWRERNLFFGGVHAVEYRQGHFSGVGDPRRGGVCRTL